METQEKRHHFNFFDVLVIAALIAAMVLVWFIFFGSENKAAETVKVQYTIELKYQRPFMSRRIHEGDRVQDGVRYGELGHVVRVVEEPQTDMLYNEDTGEMTPAIYPSRYRITVTLEAEGKRTETALLIGSYDMFVGKLVAIRSSEYAAEGYVTAVQIMEEK